MSLSSSVKTLALTATMVMGAAIVPAQAEEIIAVTHSTDVAPVAVAPVTTIRAIETNPPVTTTYTSTDGNTVSTTTSTSSSSSYYEERHSRPYHGRPVAITEEYVSPTSYSRTTTTQLYSADEIPGTMSLEQEANLAINAPGDFN